MAQFSFVADYDLRIFRFFSNADGERRMDVPLTTDYTRGLTVGLTESVTRANGRVTRVDYLDPDNTDLVVREDFTYAASSRTLIITWYREDGAAHSDTKTVVRVFADRDAVVREIFSLLREHGGGTANQNRNARRALLTAYREDFEDYAMSGDEQIIASITADATLGWLDNLVGGKSIREHITDRLDAAL